jgi:hypothetical protein
MGDLSWGLEMKDLVMVTQANSTADELRREILGHGWVAARTRSHDGSTT